MKMTLKEFTVESTHENCRLTLTVNCKDKEAEIRYVRDGIIKKMGKVDYFKVDNVDKASSFLHGNAAFGGNSLVENFYEYGEMKFH